MTTHAYNALATAIENAGRNQLDDYSRQVWKAHGAGIVADDQAQRLAEMIQQRRGSRPSGILLAAATPVLAPPKGYFIQRSAEQRTPDRAASIARRRQHAATGPLPPNLAANFTIGELAVLKVISDEFSTRGVCDLSRNEIGARAGVALTVVKQAIKIAELDHSMVQVTRRPRSGRRHLTNLIKITRDDWLVWLRKGHRKAYAVAACARAKPDFALPRGSEKSPPRSQLLKNRDSDRVDKSVEKRNRTAASRRRL